MSLPCRLRVGRSGRASSTGAFACRILAWVLLLSFPAWILLAEPPVITSFQGNGTLVWSNDAGTNAFGVEWAPAAAGPWFRDWYDLDAIVSTGTEHSVSIPMFFRVRQAFTPATMRGAWILVHPARGNFHFIAHEDGIVSESAMFIERAPSGFFRIHDAGRLLLTFLNHEERIDVEGHFATANRIDVDGIYAPAAIRRVEDVSRCEGSWAGTFSRPTFVGPPVVSNLAFQVDWRGLVTNVTSSSGHNIGRMFALADGPASGFFYLGVDPDSSDPLSEIHISGVVSGNSFSGLFECDDEHTTGTVSLVRY